MLNLGLVSWTLFRMSDTILDLLLLLLLFLNNMKKGHFPKRDVVLPHGGGPAVIRKLTGSTQELGGI